MRYLSSSSSFIMCFHKNVCLHSACAHAYILIEYLTATYQELDAYTQALGNIVST